MNELVLNLSHTFFLLGQGCKVRIVASTLAKLQGREESNLSRHIKNIAFNTQRK